jgi:hypothetical protein
MATTTPNFGWSVPTSTDLVKDGATAIETLGDAIDASLVDLKGGTTGQVLAKNSNTDMDFTWAAIDPLVILDAKGDLITATAADTPARLAVGTNGQVLTADSTASTGLKWAAASSGGGLTLLATATPSAAASFNFTSISGSYKNLLMVWKNFQASAGGTFATMTLNNDTGSNYDFQTLRIKSQGSNIAVDAADGGPTTSMMGGTSANQAFGGQFGGIAVQTAGRGWLRIWNYTGSNYTNYDWHSKSYDNTVPQTIGTHGWGGYNNSAAITRIDVTASGGTLTGTCYLYGES